MNTWFIGATSWINKELDRFSAIRDRLVIFSALVDQFLDQQPGNSAWHSDAGIYRRGCAGPVNQAAPSGREIGVNI